MRQIIRVEHEDGIGMFCGSDRPNAFNTESLEGIGRRHNTFNTPWEDGLEFGSGDFCAYKSIEHIQKWILPEEFPHLFENGYKVYLITVSDWLEGEDNMVFKKENIVSKEDISQLFKN